MRAIKTVSAAMGAVLLVAGSVYADLELPRVSPNATVTQTVGTTEMSITYSRPGVKGRVIWGELVPYGEVWRTGANEATRFTVTDDVTVGGKALPAGSYSLATIPGKDAWTVIFNKESELWGMYQYKPEQDALRIEVQPEEAPFVERMRFTFDDLTDDSADVVLRWEKVKVAFTVKVDSVGATLARARKEVAAAAADDWRTPYMAAGYCLGQKTAMDEGEAWLKKSLAVKETPQNLGLKARFQAENGDVKGAIATARKAIEMAKAAGANTAGLERMVSEWEAMK